MSKDPVSHDFTFSNAQYGTTLTVTVPLSRGEGEVTAEEGARIARELTRGESDDPNTATRARGRQSAPYLLTYFYPTDKANPRPFCKVCGEEADLARAAYLRSEVMAWLATPGIENPESVNDILDRRLELRDLSHEAVQGMAYGLEYFQPWGEWAKPEPLAHYFGAFPVIRAGLIAIRERATLMAWAQPVEFQATARRMTLTVQLWEPCEKCGAEPSCLTPCGHLCERCAGA